MIDLKSALESVQYNTGGLGALQKNNLLQNQGQQNQSGQNTGVLASILKKIIPSLGSGGAVPPAV